MRPEKKKARVDEANSNIGDFLLYLHSSFCTSKISMSEKERLHSELGIKFVMHIHNKKTPTRKNYKNMDEIRSDAMNEILDIDSSIEPLWSIIQDAGQPEAPKAPSVEAGAQKKSIFVNYTDFVAESANRGFKAGCTVKSVGGEKAEYTLVGIDSNGAELKDGSGNMLQVKLADLIDQYKAQEVVETTIATFSSFDAPSKHKEYSQKLEEATKRKALAAAWDANQCGLELVDIRSMKKSRHVHASVDAKKGELLFVPLSLSIGFAAKVEDIPSQNVQFGPAVSPGGQVAYICPTKRHNMDPDEKKEDEEKKEEFMVPYWWVRSTEDPESANMVESSVQVEVECKRVAVPVLKNFKKVATNECLLVLKKQTAGGNEVAPKATASACSASPKKAAGLAAATAAVAKYAAEPKKASGKGKKGKGRGK